MLHTLRRAIGAILLAGLSLQAQEVLVYTAPNPEGKVTAETIEKAFVDTGFTISENRDMNLPYTKQFNETPFSVYNLFTFYAKAEAISLAKTYPQIGLFAPISMSFWTKKGETTISASVLTAKTLATILEIPADSPEIKKIGEMTRKALELALPGGHYETLAYIPGKPEGERVSAFSLEMGNDEWEDAKDEFQMEFEGMLATDGFVMAGFTDLNYEMKEHGYEGYDFYDVYSICKLPVIYNAAKTRPEAGAYAPCSLYMYKKKDEEMMHIAFPSVYNWMGSLAIEDKVAIDELKDAQMRMEKILKSLTE
jgi:uncharacterized protein (DUF302 family)